MGDATSHEPIDTSLQVRATRHSERDLSGFGLVDCCGEIGDAGVPFRAAAMCEQQDARLGSGRPDRAEREEENNETESQK